MDDDRPDDRSERQQKYRREVAEWRGINLTDDRWHDGRHGSACDRCYPQLAGMAGRPVRAGKFPSLSFIPEERQNPAECPGCGVVLHDGWEAHQHRLGRHRYRSWSPEDAEHQLDAMFGRHAP